LNGVEEEWRAEVKSSVMISSIEMYGGLHPEDLVTPQFSQSISPFGPVSAVVFLVAPLGPQEDDLTLMISEEPPEPELNSETLDVEAVAVAFFDEVMMVVV